MVSIKSEEEIKLMKEAGHINYLTHQYLKDHLKEGITTKYLDELAYKFITEHGGYPSCLNYEGYPASICVSVNDEVVHGIPGPRVLVNGDVVSIDMCVEYKGYNSDSTYTTIVGQGSKEDEYLVKHTQEALYKGIQMVKNGVKIGTISNAIETYAKEHKLGVVRELVGHGIGKTIHEGPDVPNYGKKNTGLELKTGMTIAIEPMLTLGSRNVCIENNDWTIVTRDGSDAAHFEHTVLVTDDGYEILTGE